MIELNLKEIHGKPNESIYVKGKEEPGDGGGGYFIWDEPPKEEDNTGTIIGDGKEEFEYIFEPIIEELTPYNLCEHQPLDYYKYGEYPRFKMPIANRCRYKTIRRKKTK